MSGLAINFNLEEIDGCQQWSLSDTTGTYDAVTNPTGWETPNPATTDSMVVTFLIKKYGDTVGYLITLTMVGGIITVFTITDPLGNVVNWLPTLSSTNGFIANDGNPLIITPSMIGVTDTDATFDADCYYFEENITIAGTIYTASEDQLITCSQCCCLENMNAALEPTDCECQNEKIEKTVRANIFLDSAVEAMEFGDVDKSHDLIVKSKELCGSKCNNC